MPIPEPPEFSWANAAPGLILVALGFLLSLFICQAVFGEARNGSGRSSDSRSATGWPAPATRSS